MATSFAMFFCSPKISILSPRSPNVKMHILKSAKALLCVRITRKRDLCLLANSPRFEYEKCPRMFAHFGSRREERKSIFKIGRLGLFVARLVSQSVDFYSNGICSDGASPTKFLTEKETIIWDQL